MNLDINEYLNSNYNKIYKLDNIFQLFSRIVELINKLGDAMKDLHINKIPRLNTFIVKR